MIYMYTHSKTVQRFTYYHIVIEVSKGAKIMNRYIQVPHLTQDTNGKVTNSQLDTIIYSQEVRPSPAGDHKAHMHRRAQRRSKHNTEKHKRSTKEVALIRRLKQAQSVLGLFCLIMTHVDADEPKQPPFKLKLQMVFSQ